MKTIASLFLALALAACASHPVMVPIDPPTPIAPEPVLPANQIPTPINAVPGTTSLEEYYKILIDQEPSLAVFKKDGTKTEVPMEGYYRAVAPTMTRGSGNLFALFHGQQKDLVIVEARRCSPECSYAYTAYEFDAGSYKQLLFSSFLPKDDIERTARAIVPHGNGGGRRRHHHGGSNGSLVSGWPRAEHMRIRIPAKTDSIPFYVLREVHSRRREEVTYYDIGTLRWQSADFHFSLSARSKAKSLGKLDD